MNRQTVRTSASRYELKSTNPGINQLQKGAGPAIFRCCVTL